MPTENVKKVANSVANTPDENATDFVGVYGRLKDATGAKTDTDLAHALGLRQSSVSSAKSKKELPPAWIFEIAKRFNVSSDWILFGSGEMNRDSDVTSLQNLGSETRTSHKEPLDEPGFTLIPKVKARLNAGTGSLETSAETIGHYAFKTQFLKRKGNSTRMVLMDIHGDSMEPVLEDQDTVLIDESQNEILSGCMFAVGVDNEVFVKYVDREPGMLILRSRNERYKPIEVPMSGDLADTVRIIGRVVWSCREYGG
ncbi:helix-turn-helix transcriptional regulator [Desulfovibrio sulfodismutans]|uniref:Helix-turn-helix transcriptional regulator n=2 Tax=Desulfolutivibrio sulfodismutans TaxID=63561 RepID=A0A7K3NKF7_9BACT|nr:helix-turn-helix transcriptional regulator [Desulfolutivibrio sulfodismutans]QLA14539.1 helix-turn-helix transcriptional regulator [Desulfolutivibrio sulfodismutans DSM 3696]